MSQSVKLQTFSLFLKESKNISSAVLERFIEFVGGALAEIEQAGLSHGDLHEGNILVEVGSEPNVAQKFWVIDFIGAYEQRFYAELRAA